MYENGLDYLQNTEIKRDNFSSVLREVVSFCLIEEYDLPDILLIDEDFLSDLLCDEVELSKAEYLRLKTLLVKHLRKV